MLSGCGPPSPLVIRRAIAPTASAAAPTTAARFTTYSLRYDHPTEHAEADEQKAPIRARLFRLGYRFRHEPTSLTSNRIKSPSYVPTQIAPCVGTMKMGFPETATSTSVSPVEGFSRSR